MPSYAGISVAAKTFTQRGTAIQPFQIPAPTGGNGTYDYVVTGLPRGLVFDEDGTGACRAARCAARCFQKADQRDAGEARRLRCYSRMDQAAKAAKPVQTSAPPRIFDLCQPRPDLLAGRVADAALRMLLTEPKSRSKRALAS